MLRVPTTAAGIRAATTHPSAQLPARTAAMYAIMPCNTSWDPSIRGAKECAWMPTASPTIGPALEQDPWQSSSCGRTAVTSTGPRYAVVSPLASSCSLVAAAVVPCRQPALYQQSDIPGTFRYSPRLATGHSFAFAMLWWGAQAPLVRSRFLAAGAELLHVRTCNKDDALWLLLTSARMTAATLTRRLR
jgi:hypothetical protein